MSGDLEAFVDDFLNYYDNRKSYSVIKAYGYAAEAFADWYDGKLAAVDEETVDAFVRHLQQSHPDSTVHKRYVNFKIFCDYLTEKKDVWDENPTTNFHPYQPQGPIDRTYTQKAEETREEITYIEPEVFEKIVAHVPPPKTRNETILKLMWQTGVRQGELTEIRLSDVDEDERHIRIKTAKTPKQKFRDVWYHDNLVLPLRRWKRDRESYPTSESPYLFVSERSGQLYEKRPNKIVTTAAENAGVQEFLYTDAKGDDHSRITSHALRHSFAVHAVRNGMDIKTLKDILGHESIETTAIYLKFKKETKREKMMKYGPR